MLIYWFIGVCVVLAIYTEAGLVAALVLLGVSFVVRGNLFLRLLGGLLVISAIHLL